MRYFLPYSFAIPLPPTHPRRQTTHYPNAQLNFDNDNDLPIFAMYLDYNGVFDPDLDYNGVFNPDGTPRYTIMMGVGRLRNGKLVAITAKDKTEFSEEHYEIIDPCINKLVHFMRPSPLSSSRTLLRA